MTRSTKPDYPESRLAGLKKECKLTMADVDEIRSRYRYRSKDANMAALADEFGVSTTTIFNIVRERKWKCSDWQFRQRSVEPRSSISRMHKADIRKLDRSFRKLIKLSPEDPEVLASYQRFLSHLSVVEALH